LFLSVKLSLELVAAMKSAGVHAKRKDDILAGEQILQDHPMAGRAVL
jgi:hypothetical protein